MKRSLTLAAAVLVSLAFTQQASAQVGGQAGSMADEVHSEAKSQLAARKKYTASPSRGGYMSSTRSNYRYGGSDPTGRFDMAGRSLPGYFSIRDGAIGSAGRVAPTKRRGQKSTYYQGLAAPTPRP